MGTLDIRLLGELAVSEGGVELPLPLPRSRKTRALLAFLILDPAPQRRERLCEMFWQRPDDPKGSLRWSLSKLRGLVNRNGVERLRADRQRVAFEAKQCRVDLLDLERRLEPGVDRLDVEALSAAATALSRDLLEGLELTGQPDFHAFLSARRGELQALRSTVLRALVDRHADDPAGAVTWLRALVETEPYDIEAHRRLIEALALSGRRKEAERQKKASVAQLEELGAPDLVPLERAVRVAPRVPAAGSVAPPEVAAGQRIRFCRARDGVKIAYASVGEGPPLVKTANWLNHLEFDWQSPVWRHVFQGLSRGRCLVRYDARGNGLSDWDTDDYSFESMVADLEAVVDAAGLERFPLLGLSQGCAVSVEYAARHPQRVSRLVLIGGYARGWNQVGSSALARQVEAMIMLVRMGWGQDNPAFRQMFTSIFMPDAPDENQVWFNELQRITTSPENAARLIRACGDVNVSARLSQVQAPTLVLHAGDEVMTPFKRGRELAAGIPDARLVVLDSKNHLLPDGDPAWQRLLSEVEGFLAE